MLSVWKTKPKEGLEIKETNIPKIKDDEVLIKVKATSICGTDMHIYRWDDWAQSRITKNLPYIFGHEVSGEVIELGKNVKGVEIGDHVSAETHIPCGHCFQCRTGKEHICTNVKILGVDVNGTFAEYIALPYKNAWVNDKKIPHWIASVQEPLGNAVHTVFDGEVAGKTVAIFGLGSIGICAVRLCKLAGAEKVIAVEGKDSRLKLAKEFGADILIDIDDEDVEKAIMDSTDGLGTDVFLEMAGSSDAMKHGLATLKPGGRASILGIFSKPFEINVTRDIVFKGARINGINGRLMYDTWYKTKSFLPKMGLERIITHRFKLSEIEKGFDVMKEGTGLKVVLEP